MAQNEIKAMRGMPLRVRSMEGLGTALLDNEWKQPVEEQIAVRREDGAKNHECNSRYLGIVIAGSLYVLVHRFHVELVAIDNDRFGRFVESLRPQAKEPPGGK